LRFVELPKQLLPAHSINQSMSSGAVLGGDVVIGGDVGW
jgi:hypothetical protein